MNKILGLVLLTMGVSVVAMAGSVPEISAGSAGSALTLVSGVALILRGRRRK